MNREIIFRGKSSVTNEWVYGSLVKCGNENHIIGFDEVDLDGHHIRYCSDRPVFTKQGTIGQFTGLHDANGKEIYEGDIFQVKAYEPKFEVFFKNGVFEYRQIGIPNRPYPLRRINIDSYVIGNIYDNPELMEETK